MKSIQIPAPALQIDFSYALGQIRSVYLQDALATTIDGMDISEIDRELAVLVPREHINALARHGLRGELMFPVPCLFKKNPFLLGYYRLLLGFSQKEFYTTAFGVSGFKSMEARGVLTSANEQRLEDLCRAMIGSGASLVDGIGVDRLSKQLLDDLTL